VNGYSVHRVRRRVAGLFVLISACLVLVLFRLCYLQIWNGMDLTARAMGQRLHTLAVKPERGAITDREGELLAVSIEADAVFACPDEIDDISVISKALSQVLEASEENLIEKIRSSSTPVWLNRKITPEQAEAIRKMRLPGIYIIRNPQRYYPAGELAGHVIGVAGIDNQGLEGIEYFYDRDLRGSPGQVVLEKDAAGGQIPNGIRLVVPPQPGNTVVLTIDKVLQHIAQTEISRAVAETKAEAGTVILMDPNTGEIYALAIAPAFDPGDLQSTSSGIRRNIAICDQYEPGSTFKVITAAAALEENVVKVGTTFVDEGKIEIGGITVHSWKPGGHGKQTFHEALENSCNTVFAVVAANYLGPRRFYDYLRAFGFGARLGVDYPGEGSGYVPDPSKTRAGLMARYASIGFGQGIAVTPLQLITAVAAIANDGVLLRPRLVKEIRDNDGKVVREYGTEVIRRVISSETAEQLRRMLHSVVEHGTGKQAKIDGYKVAGKTGTAQVARPDGSGYGEERIASFIGFAPYDNPVLIALVVLYCPETEVKYGGVLAAPVFSRTMRAALRYMTVKADDSLSQTAEGVFRVVVPDVRGLGVAGAQRRLAGTGLKMVTTGNGDIVIDQEPAPLTSLSRNGEVTVYLSSSDEAVLGNLTTTVPDVTGLSMRDAAVELGKAGLTISMQGTGAACEQDPGPGEQVSRGTVVRVAFSPPKE